MARNDPSTNPNPEGDPHPIQGHSQDQARDILAQWRAHTLSSQSSRPVAADEAIQMAEVFKVLSDGTRLNVLDELISNGEMCVGELADRIGMSQSSVSHHLRILRHSRMLRARRQGREVYYASDDSHIESLMQVCLDHLREK